MHDCPWMLKLSLHLYLNLHTSIEQRVLYGLSPDAFEVEQM